MKIFVPYTDLHEATRVVLTGHKYEPVSMVSDDSYLNYFKQRWREGESFINIEHDCVFWCGALEEIERCNKEWCAFGINNELFGNGALPTLNLVKFSNRFIEGYPDIWDLVIERKKHPSSTLKIETDKGILINPMWHGLDYWLHHIMSEQNVTCHQHFPPVVNARVITSNTTIMF